MPLYVFRVKFSNFFFSDTNSGGVIGDSCVNLILKMDPA